MIDVLAGLAPAPTAERELEALCRRCGVRRLDLFGSAATGKFDPAHSDLDFLVSFEPAPPRAYAKTFFDLNEGLAKLFGREVDLVIEDEMKNPYLRKQVMAERRLVFEA